MVREMCQRGGCRGDAKQWKVITLSAYVATAWTWAVALGNKGLDWPGISSGGTEEVDHNHTASFS